MSRTAIFVPILPWVDDLRLAIQEMRTDAHIGQKALWKLIDEESANKGQCLVSRTIGQGTQRKKPKNVRYEDVRLLTEAILGVVLKESGSSCSDIYGVLVEEGRIIRILKRNDQGSTRDWYDKHTPR